jgi:ABC-type glutathione transport system ATPase component
LGEFINNLCFLIQISFIIIFLNYLWNKVLTKKEKKIIKESIEILLDARTDMVGMINKIMEKQYPNLNDFMRHRSFHTRTIRISFDKPLIKLNDLLDKSEQVDEVLEIQKEMARINAKQYITVDEFTKKYGLSSNAQRIRRGRRGDPLPYYQDGDDCLITYDVEEVNEWRKRNRK